MASNELAVRPEVLNPITGELVQTADLPAVAQNLDSLRQLRDKISRVIAEFSDAVIVRSRVEGTKTFNMGRRGSLIVTPDNEIIWDVEVLQELLDAGLPQERWLALVTEIVSYKVNGTVARQIEGSNPQYAEIVGRARVRTPKKQYVQFKPS